MENSKNFHVRVNKMKKARTNSENVSNFFFLLCSVLLRMDACWWVEASCTVLCSIDQCE